MGRLKMYALGMALSLSLTACGKAEDASALYKSKCSTCHAADGSGRKVMKGTDLLSGEARKKSDAQLTVEIAKGGEKKNQAHAFEAKGLSAEQINQLVAYVRELQKKK
jgi:mono/diheme cytochrome c family protein